MRPKFPSPNILLFYKQNQSYRSAKTSRGDFPWAQLRTIHAESMPAKKPLAIPVPIGQKGYMPKKLHQSYCLPNLFLYTIGKKIFVQLVNFY